MQSLEIPHLSDICVSTDKKLLELLNRFNMFEWVQCFFLKNQILAERYV